MHRASGLFSQIGSPDNLRLAFCRASRGKSGKAEVIAFRADIEARLKAMARELETGSLQLGGYRHFTIFEPKERIISALSFRDRVLQHAIINVCERYFEQFQIYDSYACRKGKGVDKCLARAQQYCRLYPWFLKLDVHKYFDTICHSVLLTLLEKRFKDKRLLSLFADIVLSYEVTPGRGIPIGNLTSQYFANHYLAWLDHEIKDRWRVPGYVRYMDDMLLFAQDKQSLRQFGREIAEYLYTKLSLTLNPWLLNRCSRGVPFLSYVVLGHKLRLSLKAKRRFRQKIAQANATQDATRALPLLAFVMRADSLAFRRQVLGCDPVAGQV